LKRRIQRAIAQDKELVVDPRLFPALIGELPGLTGAEVLLKRGRASNELTRYRYDVVLHFGTANEQTACDVLDWDADLGSIAKLREALAQRRWMCARIHSIPDLRAGAEMAAQHMLEASEDSVTVGSLRSQLKDMAFEHVDPEDIWQICEAEGYAVSVSPGQDGRFEIALAQANRPLERMRCPPSLERKPWSAYANDPLENNFRQTLVSQLRAHAAERLPDHMIPTSWVVLKQMPLTPNGKLDRRALPAPQARAEELGEYVPPQSEVERALADIWSRVLRVDRVGVQDNFFDLGGHSLLVVKALFEINSAFSSELKVVDVYRNPTIQELVARLHGESTQDAFVDLAREAALDDDLRPTGRRSPAPSRAVLLTGGTGFVGRFLLEQILQDTDCTVYCLVRSPTQEQAQSRLQASLQQWGLWRDEFEPRVIAVPGDLRSEHLGIDDATYTRLSEVVDCIYHCGTSMNHLETYAIVSGDLIFR